MKNFLIISNYKMNKQIIKRFHFDKLNKKILFKIY